MSLLIAEDIGKNYQVGEVVIPALRGVSFEIDASSFVSFIGPSGSGKTTLLNLIGCLDKPTSGRLTVAGADVGTMDRKQSATFRGTNIGFIFQDFNLLPVLTVYENIEYHDLREDQEEDLQGRGLHPDLHGKSRFAAVEKRKERPA
jgi:putative ABC transport system ATP-binding protein